MDINEGITKIGKLNFRNDERVFGIKDSDRLNHIYCIGKSGTGKSSLLLNMANSDIERGKSLAIIDPHGDLAEEILNHIPYDRIDDVIYFSPTEYPIAFNILRNVHPQYQHLVASGVLSSFQKLYADFWGPRMAHILLFSILTLLEYQKATLLDIAPLLTDDEFRAHVLTRIQNVHLLDFWYNEYDKYTKSLRAEAIAPILNKVGIFSTSTTLREVFGNSQKGIDMEQIMNSGNKILIVNLSKGKLGEEPSKLIGGMILTAIQITALSRSNLTISNRKPFYVYLDEAHNFITLSIADILSECRKYGLSLFLTHQYIEQLEPEIRSAIFGNIGTIISFRVGNEDGKYLEKVFAPYFKEYDLINLPKFNMYLKLMIDGSTSLPFSAISLPIKLVSTSHKSQLIETLKAKSKKGFLLNENHWKQKKPEQPGLFG